MLIRQAVFQKQLFPRFSGEVPNRSESHGSGSPKPEPPRWAVLRNGRGRLL